MASKQTFSQRQKAQNKGVSAKDNPFKAADKKAQGSNPSPIKGLPKAGLVGGGSSAQQADVAASNIDKLLKWCQKRTKDHKACDVTNFTSSWEDGKALCCLLNYLLGDEELNPEDVSGTDFEHNRTLAIKVASKNGVPELIIPEELGKDRRSMITYLHMVYTKLFVEKKNAEEEKKKAEGEAEG